MPAPKGNKFAFGCEKSGAPRLWNSPAEMQQVIDKYFDDTDQRKIIIQQVAGKDPEIVKIPVGVPYSIEGLSDALGCTRQTLLNYQKAEGYEEYFDIVSRAKRKVTRQYIECGLVGSYNANLVRFLLSNNDEYKNKEEITHKGTSIKVEITD